MSKKYKFPSKDPIHNLKKEMVSFGFNEITIKSYVYYITNILTFINKSPREITSKDIISYLEKLVKEKKSRSTLNTAHSALKFYFEKILNRKFFSPNGKIGRAKLPKKPPVFLSEKEVSKLITKTKRAKYKLIFSLMNETGIRISEVVNLHLGDLDFENKLIKINKKKTKSLRGSSFTRKIATSNELLKNLKNFTLGLKKSDFIFTNQKGVKITERAVQKAFLASLKTSNIYKPATCNSLRHSFAFNLAKKGLTPDEIQNFLGHKLAESSKLYIKMQKNVKIKKKIKNIIKIK